MGNLLVTQIHMEKFVKNDLVSLVLISLELEKNNWVLISRFLYELNVFQNWIKNKSDLSLFWQDKWQFTNTILVVAKHF